MGTNYTGQGIILEQMSRGINSGGEIQPMTNFKEGFKSFAVSMGAIESSFTGQVFWSRSIGITFWNKNQLLFFLLV